MKSALLLFISVTLILALATSPFARIIDIPDDFETIQAGIDEADDGDTVLVQPGEYVENINFGGKAILVSGTPDNPAHTIIDGERAGSVVTFNSQETRRSVLCGFTIRNGLSELGGGVQCLQSEPTMRNLVIQNNEAHPGDGNRGFGGGIYAHYNSPLLEDVVVENNHARIGGGINNDFASMELHRVSVQNNEVSYLAGGIYIEGARWGVARPILDHVLVVGHDSHGILVLSESEVTFTNLTVVGNEHGILQVGSQMDTRSSLTNSIIWGNGGDYQVTFGVDVMDDGRMTLTLSYCDIEGGRNAVRVFRSDLDWGEGNIDEDPLFENPDEGDYHLTIDSPCIDTGDPDSPEDPDGTRADMGAFPFNQGGYVEGYVLNFTDDSPLEGATVRSEFGRQSQTDENGFFRFQLNTPEPIDLTASLQGYNDEVIRDLEAEPLDTVRFTFRLHHPEFQLSEEEIIETVESDSSVEVDLLISNNGNGPLDWRVERHLKGDADHEPWELRQSIPVGRTVEDSRIEGVVYIDNLFYVVGANRVGHQDDPNLIYILNRDGEPLDSVEQPGDHDGYGMRDLAWDGELIWGSGEPIVYGMNREGEVEDNFEGPYSINNVLTWDSDREILWVGSMVQDDIVGFNRHHEGVAEVDRHGFRMYGLAYLPDDPDDCPLYIFHSPNSGRQVVHKMNPDTGDTIFVRELEPEDGGSPGGAFITNRFDQYSCVFMNISNMSADDRIDIWQLDRNVSWMIPEPTSGTLEGEASSDFGLTLTAEGLPRGLWEGALVFRHNAAGGEAVIPVMMTVEPSVVDYEGSDLPEKFSITSVYPNPFNSITRIEFDLPVRSQVTLRLYDTCGRLAAEWSEGYMPAGRRIITLDACRFSAGVYFCSLSADKSSAVRKVVLLR